MMYFDGRLAIKHINKAFTKFERVFNEIELNEHKENAKNFRVDLLKAIGDIKENDGIGYQIAIDLQNLIDTNDRALKYIMCDYTVGCLHALSNNLG